MDRAGADDLVQRIETAAAQCAFQGLCCLPEQRRSEVVYRAAEVGMVEDVEEVRARLQPNALSKGEGPAQGEIDMGGAEAAQGHRIPNRRTRCQECWSRLGSW